VGKKCPKYECPTSYFKLYFPATIFHGTVFLCNLIYFPWFVPTPRFKISMVWPPQHKKCKCVIVYKQVMNGFISTFFFSACLSHTPTKIVKNLGFSWLTYYITRSSQQLHIAYFATPFTIVRLVHFIKQNISFW
jgi:hypothetical protein